MPINLLIRDLYPFSPYIRELIKISGLNKAYMNLFSMSFFVIDLIVGFSLPVNIYLDFSYQNLLMF